MQTKARKAKKMSYVSSVEDKTATKSSSDNNQDGPTEDLIDDDEEEEQIVMKMKSRGRRSCMSVCDWAKRNNA